MEFVVDNFSVWIAPEQQISGLESLPYQDLDLSWVAPMQRRRLSPFMKMALHCMRKVVGEQPLAINFSSRHGDLPKTAGLLDAICIQDTLSPTAFGLSVHNAAVGIFSILNNNTAPMNAIACGNDSIISALIDSYARLHTKQCDQLMLCHVDSALPVEYQCFADELQVDHSLALSLRLAKSGEGYFSLQPINFEPTTEPSELLPISIQFAIALCNKAPKTTLFNNQRAWMLTFHAG
ncbi:beta-ketoacyl synthase chain length factor [Pseudoalteromonas arctica]|uniref:Beta-ketoacyl synthase chain length factor n=1 Tax=Pseudoalteromonas arctica TaxID=394751 RepID=A0A7Y0HC71_9GAMM|nr:beta-ketoacyl synthase chain length factor [Pseudoalteromonas arctica]